MIICLKDWLDTDVRDWDHSNIYDFSEYDTSILFLWPDHSNFSDFSYMFLQFYLKSIEFVSAISIDTCQIRINTNTFNTSC
jgi:hypothetical protein